MSFTIPRWPNYNDFRELKPPSDPGKLTQLCETILRDFADVVDELHADVRKMLAVGNVHARRWACNEIRQYLTTTSRQLLLKDYFEKLEEARLAAKELPFVEFMPMDVQLVLEVQVEPDMPHELRIQLREALVQVQAWAHDAEQTSWQVSRSHGPSRERRAQRARRSERDRARTLATKGGTHHK